MLQRTQVFRFFYFFRDGAKQVALKSYILILVLFENIGTGLTEK